MKTVSDLRVGEIGRIQSFSDNLLAARLLPLGVLPDAMIKLVRKSPLGDAYYLQLERQKIALRRSEADVIVIKD